MKNPEKSCTNPCISRIQTLHKAHKNLYETPEPLTLNLRKAQIEQQQMEIDAHQAPRTPIPCLHSRWVWYSWVCCLNVWVVVAVAVALVVMLVVVVAAAVVVIRGN